MDSPTEPASAPTTPADPVRAWLDQTNQARTEFSIGYIRAALAKPEMIEKCRVEAKSEWLKEQKAAKKLILDADSDLLPSELEAKSSPNWHPLVRAGEMLADEARAIATGIVASLFPMPDFPPPVATPTVPAPDAGQNPMHDPSVAMPDPVDQPAEAAVA